MSRIIYHYGKSIQGANKHNLNEPRYTKISVHLNCWFHCSEWVENHNIVFPNKVLFHLNKILHLHHCRVLLNIRLFTKITLFIYMMRCCILMKCGIDLFKNWVLHQNLSLLHCSSFFCAKRASYIFTSRTIILTQLAYPVILWYDGYSITFLVDRYVTARTKYD